MAERWQQWMPFHIDRWRGSAHVQAMKPAARMGYLYLLAESWQTSTCSLPNDDMELQVLSGLDEEDWAQQRERILRRFIVDEDGRLVNLVLKEEWEKARNSFESTRRAKSEAGKIGNAKRWDRKTSQQDRTCDDAPSQNIATGTGTGTGTGTKTETSTKAKTTTSAVAPWIPPPWMDREAWEAFAEMRAKIRKPMTPRARELIVQKLAGFEAKGLSSTEILNNSTRNSWQDVYEPNPQTGENHAKSSRSESAIASGNRTLELLEGMDTPAYFGGGTHQTGPDGGRVLTGVAGPTLARNPG